MTAWLFGICAIIIHSPDEIRARIIEETLKARGMNVCVCPTLADMDAVLKQRLSWVVILDTCHSLSAFMPFLTRLSQKKREGKTLRISLILQSEDFCVQSDEALQDFKFRRLFCLPDPIDPEKIADLARRARPSIIPVIISFLKNTILETIRLFLKTMIIFFILVIGLAGGYVVTCITSLPSTESIENYTPYQSSEMYSADNVLLTEFFIQRRTYTPLSQIPPHVSQAIIAVEDTRFYKHNGIDIIRIGGALIADLKDRTYAQGASTITQQLAKMLFLKPDKTITRKVKEIALSFKIEKNYTKDRILEMYLNQAYFGARAYGVEAASQTYFGKPITAIDISEAALLAGLLKAPSLYSPYKNPKKALKRRNLVLKQMIAYDLISSGVYKKAVTSPMPEKFHGRKYKAPYFVDHCRTVLKPKLGDRLFSLGLKIYTTLDYKMQEIAERAVNRGLDELDKRCAKGIQAALLAVELSTGRIKAMVGGRDFQISQFNRATQAWRQPGSAFKPIVYLTALNQGFKPQNTIQDSGTRYVLKNRQTWTPRNYTGVYHGTVTLKQALAHSYNAAAVNLASRVGIKNVIKTAQRLGITSEIKPYFSSALGASEITLLELVYAYAAFAHGSRIEPMIINRIMDIDTFTITEPRVSSSRVIGERELAYLKSLLRAVVLQGSGRKAAALNREVYGKTGTTNGFVDAWFIGFDDFLAVGVWVGRDTLTPIGEGEAGSKAALPIWIEFMKGVQQAQ
ncbi:PBP1A family penicillin-binding protein [Desulfococcaceae bacterium HSG7]|nr:PBP1A family penicillin-binding protein [Desulfococcaceae bacterium HSG7]